jgi:DnaJ-class molecular chaperone
MIRMWKQKTKEKKMKTDKTITQDLFGYESVPCLECDGTGEEPNTENTCDECDGTGEIVINQIETFLTKNKGE